MGAELFHQLEGSGTETVLLLNGIAMSAATWHPVARGLCGSRRVLRCDLRGQLLSPGEPPRLEGHAEDVAELLGRLGLRPVHVVATSFGAAVAVLLAAHWPQRVRSLVLVAATDGFDDAMATEVARWRRACDDVLGGADPALVLDTLDPVVYSRAYLIAHRGERAERRRQVAAMPRSWFEGLSALLGSARGATIRGELMSVQCPTLVLAAGEDGFIPRDRCRALADGIAGSRFDVMPGAGHAVVVEQPEAIVARVVEFLDEVEAGLRQLSAGG